MLQVGVAKEQQPHYMRVLALPEHDSAPLIRYGLGLIGKRSGANQRSANPVPPAWRHGLRADL